MPSSHSEASLIDQKQKVKSGSPKIKIIAPCTRGNGILKLNQDQVFLFEEKFQEIKVPIAFFIPASGVGSRMFDFLLSELDIEDQSMALKTKEFSERIREFAFYKALSSVQKKRIENLSSTKSLIDFLLKPDGQGVGLDALPKGLVPFHAYDGIQYSPFFEHLSQGLELNAHSIAFHFTIQEAHENLFNKALSLFRKGHSGLESVHFSFQEPMTDAFVFGPDEAPLKERETYIRRPSGHGALLSNLNAIQEQYILVKNIDNVQHRRHSESSLNISKVLCGVLRTVKTELKALHVSPDFDRLSALSDRFQLFSNTEIEAAQNHDALRALVNRPLRICGMVLNEGKAGGGPFYVDYEGNPSKQIVEGVQIMGPDQQQVFESSTHFNPVMMALDTFDVDGNKFDLSEYCNEDQYFVVEKIFQGAPVCYIERPGLWNGGMFHWNTIFIEIPEEAFTPVKTILDLLQAPHQER